MAGIGGGVMTEQQHPITPPPELVEKWYDSISPDSTFWRQQLAARAARWGADQELDACCEWVRELIPFWAPHTLEEQLRAARRPPVTPETIEVDGHTYRLVK